MCIRDSINSSLTERQCRKALHNAAQGMYKIVYAAPERLLTPQFLQFAKSVPISLLCVDEAHCVSQWGQDFRPSYLQVQEFVQQLPGRPAIGAFTATATRRVSAVSYTHLFSWRYTGGYQSVSYSRG